MTLRIKHICLAALGWMALMTLVVSIPNVSPWLATPFVLIGLLFALGVLLSLVLRIRSEKILEQLLYSTVLGLAYTLVGSLIINWLLPYVGVVEPLAKLPLVVFFDASALVLAALAYHFNKDCVVSYAKPAVDWINIFFGFFPLVFLVMSVCGAQILNNGGDGTLTLAMLFGVAAYVIALMSFGKKIQSLVYTWALYIIGLSLLFMFSLRSSHILGWDINQEYEVFQLTLQHLRWQMSYYPGQDYNACLSITILPTIFKVLTNVPSEYVFKIIFQILFASVPVMVYTLGRRYLSEAFAFLAGFLFLSQTWFFEQMPGLVRQETAFVFYIGLLLVLFDSQLAKRSKYILFYIFTVGLVLSHYSTAYLWLALMFGMLVLSYGGRLFFKSLRGQQPLLKPTMFIVSLLVIVIWQIPITHTATGLANFATNNGQGSTTVSGGVTQSASSTSVAPLVPVVVKVAVAPAVAPIVGIQILIEKGIMAILFSSNNPNTNQTIFRIQQSAIQALHGTPTYADAAQSQYVPVAINENVQTTSRFPSVVSMVLNRAAWLSKIIFIDIFSLIGLVCLYITWRRRPAEDTFDLMALNLCAFGLIFLILFVPYVQVFYNLSRLYLQMFLVLSIVAVIGAFAATRKLRNYQTFILTTMAVLAFFSLNGAFAYITGGEAHITFARPPSDLDSLYVSDSEVAAIHWLTNNRAPNTPVQADVIANLRLRSFADMRIGSSILFPQTLATNSYVYLTTKNIEGYAYAEVSNNLLEYNYPLNFIDTHKALIYTNGGSMIYR